LILSALMSLRALGYYVAAATLLLVIMLGAMPNNRYALFTEVSDPIERGEVYKVPAGQEQPTLVKKRWLEWRPALVMLADNFPLGVGPGNYQLHIGEQSNWGYVPNVKKIEPDTNNLYLVVASSMGFVGLAAFMAWLGRFWRLAEANWTQARDGWSMGLCWGLLGSVYGILVVNLFSSLFVRGTSIVWALIFAMIASIATRGVTGEDVSVEEERPQEIRRED
jgi:O-antigen ligase